MKPTKETLAYLAGVMDSDGYFTVKRSTYSARVIKDSTNPTHCEKCGIKQTSPQAIKLIYKYFGGYLRTGKNIEKSASANGKPLHGITLVNQKAHKFICAIYPYLRIKRRQAKLLMILRNHLNRGKEQVIFVRQNCRWNKEITVRKYRLSPEQVAYRDKLFEQIRSLNDARYDITHQRTT